jgi:cytochrome c-type biogenesis protein CcmH
MRALLLALALLLPITAAAVQPDEMLDDPVLEERARDISSGLRCLVCRNEAIDDSNADFARTMRLLVRERLVAGDSDEQVLDFIVDRYGEYVLLTPTFSLANALIWLAGPLLLIVGGWLAWRYASERHAAAATAEGPAPLSEDEQQRLTALLESDR